MMDKYTKSWLYGYLLGICGKPVPLAGSNVPSNALVSADGYVLTDKNGVYLIPKEV